MTLATPRFAACKTPRDALASLGCSMQPRQVWPADMPEDTRTLLVHHGHMTKVLEAHHGGPVRLTVQKDRLSDGVYWRQILLHVNNRLVECGIVRIYLQFVPKLAADEILGRRTPLGAVLIKHEVLRRVEPRWFVAVSPSDLKDQFGVRISEDPSYGRIGVIYCNGEPAIELLEVVTDQVEQA